MKKKYLQKSKKSAGDQGGIEKVLAALMSWEEIALLEAKEAHKNNFSSRMGIFPLEVSPTKEVLVHYNNNPWAGAPERRDQETAMFRAWLDKRGVTELAYATYPSSGTDKDYSYAMLLEAPRTLMPEVKTTMEGIMQASLAMSEQTGAV